MEPEQKLDALRIKIEQLRTDLRYYEGAVTRTQARIRALEAEIQQTQEVLPCQAQTA